MCEKRLHKTIRSAEFPIRDVQPAELCFERGLFSSGSISSWKTVHSAWKLNHIAPFSWNFHHQHEKFGGKCITNRGKPITISHNCGKQFTDIALILQNVDAFMSAHACDRLDTDLPGTLPHSFDCCRKVFPENASSILPPRSVFVFSPSCCGVSKS